jgi:ATP-dependent Clp endopeptidase proteolytic subunit ClpP
MDVDANDIIKDIEAKRQQGLKSITFYVNSEGGDVEAGICLYNYLERTDIKVEWVVDGIAASMMSLLMCNPKHKVSSAKHAKLMYHRVKGFVSGNVEEIRAAADQVQNWENTLVEVVATRTKLDVKQVRKMYFQNTDKWLSATEALEAGLIDEIITNRYADIKALDKVTNSKEAFKYYANQINQKTRIEMKNGKVIAQLLGVTDTDNEDVIVEHITKVVNERNKLNGELEVERKRITDLEAKINSFEVEKITNLIDSAIADKRISADEKEMYTSLAQKDFENTSKILNKMQPVGKIVNQLGGATVLPKGQENWTWDDFHKAGKLEALKATNPEHFEALKKAKYNK